MSFYISGPHPADQTTTILPNPQFGDSEALLDTLSNLKAMNGTQYTYVKKRNGRRKLQWTFNLTRNKGLELRAFIVAYFASKVKVVDHNGRTWVGHFTNNPFEFDTPNRWGPAIAPLPRGEMQSIQIEFEGTEQ